MFHYQKNNTNSKSYFYFYIFFILNFIPFCLSGFFFDDSLNSTGFYEFSEINKDLLQQINTWLKHGSRLFITSTFTGKYFYFLLRGDLLFFLIYKIIIFSIFFFTLLFFLNTYSLKTESKFFTIFIFLLTLQFNPRWDPVTSFHPLIFFTTISILISIIYFKKSNENRFLYSFYSIISCLYAYFSYEICLVIFPSILIIFFYKKKKNWILFLLHSLIFLCFIIFSLYAREKYGINYKGNNFGTIKLFIPSFFINLFNSLPFSGLYNGVLPNGINIFSLIISIPIFYFFYIKIIKIKKKTKKHFNDFNEKSEILTISIILLIVPAFLTAISERYQILNTIGDPYITIFFSRIGISILIFFLISKYLENYKLLLIFTMLLLINFNVNLYKIHLKNLDFKYPREITKKFIKDNHFNLNDTYRLILDPKYYEEKESKCLLGLYISNTNLKCLSLENTKEEDLILKRRYDKKKLNIELIEKSGKFISHECSIYFHFYKCNKTQGKNISKRVFGPTFHGGFYGWEYDEGQKFIWSSGEKSDFKFYNYSNKTSISEVIFILDSDQSNNIHLNFNNKLVGKFNGKNNIKLDLKFKPGVNELSFIFFGKPNVVEKDPRKIFAFIVKDFKFN